MNRFAKLSCCFAAAPILVWGLGFLFRGSALLESLFPVVIPISPLLAIVFGLIGFAREVRRRVGFPRQFWNLATLALVISVSEFTALFLVFVVAHDSISHISHIAVNESSAVHSLRTLASLTAIYSETHPDVGFPADLRSLPVPPGNKESERITGVIATGKDRGFTFVYFPRRDSSAGSYQHYRITADPIKQDETGVRHFFIDDSGVVRYELHQPANELSPVLN